MINFQIIYMIFIHYQTYFLKLFLNIKILENTVSSMHLFNQSQNKWIKKKLKKVDLIKFQNLFKQKEKLLEIM